MDSRSEAPFKEEYLVDCSSDGQDNVFLSVRFFLAGFDPDREIQFATVMENNGGVNMHKYDAGCTHVIVERLAEDHPLCVAARRDGKILVSSYWVEDCLDMGKIVDPNKILYKPVHDINGIPGSKSLCICLTGYQSQDRCNIMRMVDMMGAQFTKPLVAKRVTHLICYKFEGEKYKLATQTQMKIVNHRWLEDCLNAWALLPEENYQMSGYDLENMKAEARDSEDEGDTTMYTQTIKQTSTKPLVGSSHNVSGEATCTLLEMDVMRADRNAQHAEMAVSSVRNLERTPKTPTPNQGPVNSTSPALDRATNDRQHSDETPSTLQCRSASRSSKGDLGHLLTMKVDDNKFSNTKADTLQFNNEADVVASAPKDKETDHKGKNLMTEQEPSPLNSCIAGYSRKPSGKCKTSLTPESDRMRSAEIPEHLRKPPLSKERPHEGIKSPSVNFNNVKETEETETGLNENPNSVDATTMAPPSLTINQNCLSNLGVNTSNYEVIRADAFMNVPSIPFNHASSELAVCSDSKASSANGNADNLRSSKDEITKHAVANKRHSLGMSTGNVGPTLQSAGEKRQRISKCSPNKKKKPLSTTRKTITAKYSEAEQENDPEMSAGKENKYDNIVKEYANSTVGLVPQKEATGIYERKTNLGNNGNLINQSEDTHLQRKNASSLPIPESNSMTSLPQKKGRNKGTTKATLPKRNLKTKNVSATPENAELSKPTLGDLTRACKAQQKPADKLQEASSGLTSNAPSELPQSTPRDEDPNDESGHHEQVTAPDTAEKHITNKSAGKQMKRGRYSTKQRASRKPPLSANGKNRITQGGSRTESAEFQIVASGKPSNMDPDSTDNTETRDDNGTEDDCMDKSPAVPVSELNNSTIGSNGINIKATNSMVVDQVRNVSNNNKKINLLNSKAKKKQKLDVPGNDIDESKYQGNTSPEKDQNDSQSVKIDGKKRPRSVSKPEKPKSVNKKSSSVKTTQKSNSSKLGKKRRRKANNNSKEISQALALKKTESSGISGKRDICYQPRLFLLSGHRLQRKEFQILIKNLGGKVLKDTHSWSYQATHLVVPEPLRRTEKFFAATAAGRWILKTDYLTESRKVGRFLEEEEFEWHRTGLSEDGNISLEAPRKWRLFREQTGCGALQGFRIIVYGECIAPPLDTLKRVVKAGGGQILATCPPYNRVLASGVDLAIVSPGIPGNDPWIQEFLRCNIGCVLVDYLVEYVCKPFYPLDKHVLYNTHAAVETFIKSLEAKRKAALSADVLMESPESNADSQIVVGGRREEICCTVCGSAERGDVMLLCGDDKGNGCGIGMHIDCLQPPLSNVPEEDWFCSACQTSGNADASNSTKKQKTS